MSYTHYIRLECETLDALCRLQKGDPSAESTAPQLPPSLRDLSAEGIIEIFHYAPDYDEYPRTRPDVRLPAVRDLHIFILPGMYGDECDCDTDTVLYSAERLLISAPHQPIDYTFCSYARGALSPSVERFFFVGHLAVGSSYLQAIEEKSRHPRLHVSIRCRGTTS